MRTIALSWRLGLTPSPELSPDIWVPAAIPGAIQLDMRAPDAPDYWQGDAYHQFDWMEDMWAVYEARIPDGAASEHLVLSGKGIDYCYEIRLNGSPLYRHEGMFSPFTVPLSAGWRPEDNRLRIFIAPPPKAPGVSGRKQASQSCKPPVCYGWDFHPRLLVRGIWEELRLEIHDSPRIARMEPVFSLSPDRTQGKVTLSLEIEQPDGCQIRICMRDPDGVAIFRGEYPAASCSSPSFQVESPRLWWPNGHGEAHLYAVEAQLWAGERLLDSRCFHKGFRTIRLIRGPVRSREVTQEPQTREYPPIALEVNGKAIFSKGTNWVCPTIFPGTLTRESYERPLQKIRDAHMNLIRCWGGAIVNKDDFFELCDEMGLLVWQEFPLACNNYAATPGYLETLEEESRAIIRRLRPYTCLAIWCGGNELFNGWSGMDDQSLALRILNKNCLLEDPDRPFLPTSPLMGMGHGSYVFRNDRGEDVFQIMKRSSFTAYPECGCPGAADEEALRRMIPGDEWDFIGPGTAWETHHAINAWRESSWMDIPVLEYYFGKGLSTKELVTYSRLLQSIGYQEIFEEARRQAPYCSMVLNWCFNEPWPAAANNSIYTFFGETKPAYDAIVQALRPVLFSASFPRFDYTGEDILPIDIWLLTERDISLAGELQIVIGQDGRRLERSVGINVQAAENRHLCTHQLPLAHLQPGLFTVQLNWTGLGRTEEPLNSSYTLLCRN